MKKKRLPIAAAVLLTLSLAACGAANTNNTLPASIRNPGQMPM